MSSLQVQVCYREQEADRRTGIKIAELLDEISPRGVFKELDMEFRKMCGAKKRK